MFARHWNRSVGSAIAAMLVSLSVAVPARAAAAAPHTPATPPAEKLDHDGHQVTGRAWTQRKVKDTPVTPPVWPKATTARAELPAAAARSSAARSTAATRRAKAGTLPVWIADAPGATDARLVTTLANEMRRRDVQFGLVSICAQGGMGSALVLERP